MSNFNLPRLLIADDDPVVSSMLSAQLSRTFDIVAGDVRKGTPPHELAVILQHSIEAHWQFRAAT